MGIRWYFERKIPSTQLANFFLKSREKERKAIMDDRFISLVILYYLSIPPTLESPAIVFNPSYVIQLGNLFL